MFARIGRIVVHHPWLTIVAWVIVAVGVVATAPALKATSDQADFLPSHYESIRAAEVAEKSFPQQQAPAAVLVFTSADGGTLSPAERARATAVVQSVAKNSYADVKSFAPVQLAPNGKVLLGPVIATDSSEDTLYGEELTESVKRIRADARAQLEGSGLEFGVTGETASALDQEESAGDLDQLILLASLALIVLLLLAIFRSPVMAVLPVLTIVIVMVVSTGLIGHATEAFDLKTDSSVQQLLIVVLFGVGADYFLFLMFRYRERLRAGSNAKQAMVEAVERAGEAITSAGGAVVVAFLALLLSTLGLLKSWGPALAIAVGVTVLAALTLVPAVVSLLGTKVFWPSKSWQRQPKERLSGGLGRLTGRRPGVVAGAAAVLMAGLSVFALGFTPQFDFSASGPQDLESVRSMKALQTGFPAGATQPTDILVRGDDRLDKAALTGLRGELARVEGVGQVSPVQLSPDGRAAQLSVVLDHPAASDAAIKLAGGELRVAAHRAAPPGSEVLVGGMSSVLADTEHAVGRDYRIVFPVAGLLILVILALLLRSLVAPWYLMASVALGFTAALGGAVLLFQHVRGEAGLLFQLPLTMYLFVVAIGTDYNILMVARLREEARAGHSPRQAAALAVRHTVPTIAAAGTILAGTFGVLLLADNVALQQMGFGISFGILIVAFVMSMFLTPGLTALMGHRAWWPGHQDAPRTPPAAPPARERVTVGADG